MQLYREDGSSIQPREVVLKNGRVHSHKRQPGKVPVYGECPLCREYKRIIFSHINPDWSWIITKTVVDTGQKVQNGEAFYLLCSDCDGWMGKYESYLTKVSELQIQEFRSPLHAEKISLALLAILWRASIAQTIWKNGPSRWDKEAEEWARALLLQSKHLKDSGSTNPESVLRDQLNWSALKFFTLDPFSNNPYGQQGAAEPELNNGSLGHTFIAGIFWNLRMGKGKCGVKIRYWSEEMRTKSIYSIDVLQSDLDELTRMVESTNDNDPCPCGQFETTGTANKHKHFTFASCCKYGWLRLPLTGSYWRDPDLELTLEMDGERQSVSRDSMTFNFSDSSELPLSDISRRIAESLKLEDDEVIAVLAKDNSTGKEVVLFMDANWIAAAELEED